MDNVTNPRKRASRRLSDAPEAPELGLNVPKDETSQYPEWLWPFVEAYKRHRGVPRLKEIQKTIEAVRGILSADERKHGPWFIIFAVWLYFLRDLEVAPQRLPPTVYSFARDFRHYWQQAWSPPGLNPELGAVTSRERQRVMIRELLTEDTEPQWVLEDLMRAFRE